MPFDGYILVVARDAALCDYIAEALGDEGYVVRTCHDRESARLALTQQPAHLLICDLYDTGMLCPQFIADVRAAGLGTAPIIILAHDRGVIEQLNLSEIACCLLMPFDLTELLDSVATFSRSLHEAQ